MVDMDNYININGVRFREVTNQTVSGRVFTYEEAVAYTKGRDIVTSYSWGTENKKKGKSK